MRPIPLAVALLLLSHGAAHGAVPLYPLTITVRDSVTLETCPARVSVWDSLGGSRFPSDVPQNSLFHLANGGYFYTQGVSHVAVPPGPTAVIVTRGLETRPAIVVVRADQESTVTVTLGRWIAMEDSTWFPGDAHAHIHHAESYYTLTPADAKQIASAEGVCVANYLDNEYAFTGAPDPVSDSTCIVYFTEENRASAFGHADFLGLTRLIEPLFGELGWPLLADLADSVHQQPDGVVIAAHPVTTDRFSLLGVWPGTGLGRELPVDAAMGRLDAFDVASYSNGLHRFVETQMWYQLLNCELALGASAGTDAAMNRIWDAPMGGYQVFAHVEGEPFSYGAWCRALRAQRTFITNGPMITRFRVSGHAAGDSLAFTGDGPFAVTIDVSVRSHFPVRRLDVVRNAETPLSLEYPAGTTSVDTTLSLDLTEGSWLAARVSGPSPGPFVAGDSLFAHTSPVYVRVNGRRAVHPDDAHAMVAWIDSLVALTAAAGSWTTPADSARVFETFAAARAYYEERADLGTAAAPARSQPAVLRWVRPAVRGSVELACVPSATVAIYSLNGRRVHAGRAGPDGRFVWNGRGAATGLYLCASGGAAVRVLLVR